jgi:hypothetical protein
MNALGSSIIKIVKLKIDDVSEDIEHTGESILHILVGVSVWRRNLDTGWITLVLVKTGWFILRRQRICNFSINRNVATLCTLQHRFGVCHFPHSVNLRVVWRNDTYD